MTSLVFEFDWLDGEGMSGPELSATLASLTIRAGESVVTRVFDARAKTVRDFAHVPLYPLAEWLVANWWFIAGEIPNPDNEHSQDFLRRHSLGANRDGYAFPNLDIVPSYGGRTCVSWSPTRSLWTRAEFLAGGEALVDGDEFRRTCSDFIDSVILRLDSLGVQDTFLQEEWDAIRGADDEEIQFCQAAAALGWDPYALDDDAREHVIALDDMLGGLLDEALPALDAANPLSGASEIETALEGARRNRVYLERVESFRSELGRNFGAVGTPWDEGYDWARRLRRDLNLNGEPLKTTASIADALGEDANALNRIMRTAARFSAAPMIDGAIARDGGETGFALGAGGGYHARRFRFCRALAEAMASPDSDALITRSRSERQQRNRAFAAEFLAPASAIKRLVRFPSVDGDDIDELADEFGVSHRVIAHQIANHRIARIAD